MQTKLYTFLLLSLFAGQAVAQESASRYALVIGIQNYTDQKPLRNALNDAADMTAALKVKGFQVEALYDPKTRKEIRDAIMRYYNIMSEKNGAVGVIYYAGHGLQYEGENYLIPASASLQIPGDLDEQCVKMNTMMSVLNSSSNLNILLLDACRSNAFPSFSRSTVKGLSAVEAPHGSIVVFATQPNATASDGTGRNGLFTAKLLMYIKEPGLHIGDVVRKVKQDVYAESEGKQLPSFVDNSLGGEFYFERSKMPSESKSSKVTISEPVYTPQQLFEMGNEYYNRKNYLEAAKWYGKAADQGISGAQFNLGVMYEKGWGITKNETEAARWYRKAADQGTAIAQYNLGVMYRDGQGIAQDYAEAGQWFRKAADQGMPDAQCDLGNMYSGGYGVPKDDDVAILWYRKAVDQGYARAQFSLGLRYQKGWGVAKDEKEAVRWYRKAADQGNADAQVNLGVMYASGQGVIQDYAEAVRWWRNASGQGVANAQANLGWAYQYGKGVTQDIDEAVKWYKIAAVQDNDYAKQRLKELGIKGY